MIELYLKWATLKSIFINMVFISRTFAIVLHADPT